jgi:molybdopterin converting factor small subunit
MKVRLKLFATYRRHLPPGTQGCACDLAVPAKTRVVDLLSRFDIPTDDGASAVLVNGRSADAERPLEDGDVVAVFPALAGG